MHAQPVVASPLVTYSVRVVPWRDAKVSSSPKACVKNKNKSGRMGEVIHLLRLGFRKPVFHWQNKHESGAVIFQPFSAHGTLKGTKTLKAYHQFIFWFVCGFFLPQLRHTTLLVFSNCSYGLCHLNLYYFNQQGLNAALLLLLKSLQIENLESWGKARPELFWQTKRSLVSQTYSIQSWRAFLIPFCCCKIAPSIVQSAQSRAILVALSQDSDQHMWLDPTVSNFTVGFYNNFYKWLL